MRNIFFLLFAAFVVFAAIETAFAQEDAGDDDPTSDTASNSSTSDNSTSSNDTDNANDDVTSDVAETADNGNGTDTNDDTVNDDGSVDESDESDEDESDESGEDGAMTTPSVMIDEPSLTDGCRFVVETCTGQNNLSESVYPACSTIESTCATEEKVDPADNVTKSCTQDEATSVMEYCYGNKLLMEATNVGVSENCQNRVKNLVLAKYASLPDTSDNCLFVEDNEEEMKTADTTNAAYICTEADVDKMRDETCFGCRGAVSSLLLVAVMVTVQRLFSWE